MLEILRAIETAAPVEALKASFIVYPLLNAAHIMAIGVVFTTVMLMDVAVIRSATGHESLVASGRFKPLAVGAFVLAALTGLLLFSVNASEYFYNVAFRAKLILIGLAGFNLAVFERVTNNGADRLTTGARFSAAFSIVLWVSAIIAGRFIGFL